MRLLYPQVLLALPAILLFLWWSAKGREARRQSLGYSNLKLMEWSKAAVPLRLSRKPQILFVLFWAFLLLALARPQMSLGEKPKTKEGIDILICLDTSMSMEADDLVPNRLEAAKKVSMSFVDSRPDDRLGLVIYAGIALTQCPMTTDHDTLKLLIERLSTGMTQRNGTAIGNAIATCVNRLKDLPGDSKVVILLTDGQSNAGEIEPQKAAELAAEYGIKVYCIGVGTDSLRGMMLGAGLDMGTLIQVSESTGAQAFRATDNAGLESIYTEIDRLERIEREEKPEILYRELMAIPAGLALLLLFVILYGKVRNENS